MTTPRRRESMACAQSAPARGQMSHANAFDRAGRGRTAGARRRAAVTLPVIGITPHRAMVIWSDLMTRRCGSREVCAARFGVTFQTACNWFDGFSCPTGDKVLQAVAWWPEEFGLGGVRPEVDHG